MKGPAYLGLGWKVMFLCRKCRMNVGSRKSPRKWKGTSSEPKLHFVPAVSFRECQHEGCSGSEPCRLRVSGWKVGGLAVPGQRLQWFSWEGAGICESWYGGERRICLMRVHRSKQKLLFVLKYHLLWRYFLFWWWWWWWWWWWGWWWGWEEEEEGEEEEHTPRTRDDNEDQIKTYLQRSIRSLNNNFQV